MAEAWADHLHLGDCLEVLRTLPDASVDAVVTDPPYGLAFMGKRWDYDVPSVEIWAECLRVLKPGGHLLAFAGTRTQHRMAVRIEDAGFEIRDMIAWVYGKGFPKSLNVATAIGKLAEPKAEPKAEEVEFCQWLRENSTVEAVTATLGRRFWDCEVQIVNTATKDKPIMGRRALVPTAARWQQFKAAHSEQIPDRIEQLAKPEPIRAKTPGEEWQPGKGNGTAGSGDWAGWGTALKPALEPITVARKPLSGTVAANVLQHGTGALNVDGCRVQGEPSPSVERRTHAAPGASTGATGWETPARPASYNKQRPGESLGRWPANLIHDGSEEVVRLFPVDEDGSAARYFYSPKVSRNDRSDSNTHPTVKPTDLMRYLCRLVTPPGGIVLDPFMGSGSTGKAAMLEGFEFIGIERDPEYHAIAMKRIAGAAAAGHQASLF